MTLYKQKLWRARRERSERKGMYERSEHKPTNVPRVLRTTSDEPVALVAARSQQTIRNRRVKVTLPKMPWETTP
jgi:hypothetical protein